ncbi:uncharacterized protein LOC143881520 [Tasmannia lanceolata]|uniref:uncharacterized protein LOC143881520 n=1 Tax=Tasmannia lanceolata TaxID=3420 RepID=UPI00406304BD
MDSVEQDHDEECIQDTSAYQLLSPASPGISDIYGDPQVAPRIGDEYQVNIPPLTLEWDRLQLIQNPNYAEYIVDVDDSNQIGLPIPVMWVHDKVVHIKHEPLEFPGNTIDADNMDVDMRSQQQKESTFEKKCDKNDYTAVPGLLGDSWSDSEQESFLLGIYIFGKNLVQVKRFVESKEMGDILSFYYGKFYRSDGHHRWSECRKIRSRRCIHGQRLFTGLRQQELLSRLLSRVSEECGNTLLEASKTFSEGKISLEEYVSTLKATVGLGNLVDAVGVGKGKQDLTGMVMEPIKTNHVISARSEIPIGKACSSLTSEEIIKFLTGDFRLSKARSNDLFWEAVWPRLLARGWHSEQPNNHSYVGSKHSLVFLIPGVKKFSRRRLVKGNDYFDSVTDVLNKVASDPMLLELEVETVNGNISKEDYGWDMDAKLDQSGLSDHQRHCYLLPRPQNCSPELLKFTVVDTSLVHGQGPYKVRELRTLPVDSTHIDSPASLSRETEGTSSEEQVDDQDSAEVNMKLLCGPRMPMDGTNSTYVSTENHKDQNPDMLTEKHRGKSIKCAFSRRVKSDRPNYLSPVPKRRRLNACNISDKEEKSGCWSNLVEARDVMGPQIGPSQQKTPTRSSDKGSPVESSEHILSENCFAPSTVSETEFSNEKPQLRGLIDLNLPHVPLDFETGEPFIGDAADSQVDFSTKGASNVDPEESQSLRTSNGMSNVEPARRQSTRNRPLTTRALEALQCDFFNTKRRRKGRKALSCENEIPKSSSRRRARGSVGVSVPTMNSNSGNVSNSVMDSKVEGVDEKFSSNTNMVNKSQIRS